MRILLVTNKFPSPPRDGGSLASYTMASGLAENGSKVDLLAMNTSKHYIFEGMPESAVTGVNKTIKVFVDTSHSIRDIISNLLFSTLPYNSTRFISDDFSKALKQMLKESSYDIVQLEGLYLAPYIDTIRGNSAALVSYRAHNIEHIIWKGFWRREKNPFRRWYYRNLYKRILKFEQEFINKYDLLVPITKQDELYLGKMGNTRESFVSAFGMYPSEIPLFRKSVKREPIIQYIGALDWKPNIDGLDWFIDRVWARVKSEVDGAIFMVAGRNSERGYARNLVRNSIDFRGEVGSAAKYLMQSGILVVPLFAGSGIRVRIIEAMLMGKPIVATSFAVTGIPVENGRHLLLADNEDDFAGAVSKMLRDPDFAFRIGRNARELALENFDNRVITGKLISFYKNSLQ